MKLNHEKGSAPLYFQISNILKEMIEEGEFSSGDLFYSEKQLQEMFGVSRVTVRQAVSSLTNAGYLQCSRGIGTTVTFRKIDENLKRVISFSEEMKQHNVEMETVYSEIFLENPNKAVASALKIDYNNKVYKIIRVRNANNQPLVYSTTYLNLDFDFPLEPKLYEKSLYEFMNREFGIHIISAQDTLEAVSANQTISQHLKIPVNSPVFKRSRWAQDQYLKTIEYSICFYPGNKYKYSVMI